MDGADGVLVEGENFWQGCLQQHLHSQLSLQPANEELLMSLLGRVFGPTCPTIEITRENVAALIRGFECRLSSEEREMLVRWLDNETPQTVAEDVCTYLRPMATAVGTIADGGCVPWLAALSAEDGPAQLLDMVGGSHATEAMVVVGLLTAAAAAEINARGREHAFGASAAE